MIEVKNNSVYVTTDKLYIIPLGNIGEEVYNNEELLKSISMKDLAEVFVYGIPSDFAKYLLKKVSLYDSSSDVNSFIYHGLEYWLDKLLRTSISHLLDISSENALDIVLGDDIYTIKSKELKTLLDKLEIYSYKCKIATQKHIAAINALEFPNKLEDFKDYINFILDYDYTIGYPEKIEL